MQLNVNKHAKWMLIAAFSIIGCSRLSAQSTPSTQADPVVIIIGNDSITLSEFKNNYQKNNNLKNATTEGLKNYLDLYVNYRLKCAEARSLHMDTIQRLKDELRGYRKQAAAVYLTEKSVNDQLVKEAMENARWDIRAWHIMKKLPMEPQPKDTLAAYKSIMQLRNRLQQQHQHLRIEYF